MKMFWSVLTVVFIAAGSTRAISVQCPVKRYVVMLFQPVTLTCNYQTSAIQRPVVTWRYKSFCRDPIQAALNPSSADNILSQNNPNYDPNIECADSLRTVHIVAAKEGNAITLGPQYQGRKISILNNADLNIAQTEWGDSGVYVCSVVSSQDLTGNSEDYTELIVLDWLLVVLVVFGFLMLLLLIGICWCQCCPHTCCCYVSCPCCPERCCCPRALYEAGKAVKKGIPSQYAPTLYAPSLYAQPAYIGGMNQPAMPLLPIPNGARPPPSTNDYNREYDGASSVGQGSQVPLLHDQDNGADHTRSGYRIQVDPDGNATRAIYYMERELANLDPTRPGNYNRLDGGMSEVSSLHDNLEPRGRGGRSQAPPLATVYDRDEAMSTISSVSQQAHRRDDYPQHGRAPPRGYMDGRGRARSMDDLDVIARHHPKDNYQRRNDVPRGRRGLDDEWSTSGHSGFDDRRRRDYSPDDRRGGAASGGLQGKRSRSRDDLMDLERDRQRGAGARGGRDAYDDSFLREAMERKKLGEQQRARSREHLDSESNRSDRGRVAHGPPPLPLSPPSAYPGYRDNFPPPPPPPYSDDESISSSKKSNLRKNGAVSRESLVV